MKQSKEDSRFFEVLTNYYERYLAYSQAYANQGDTRENISKELKEALEDSDSTSTKFKNLAKEYLNMNAMQSSEVAHSASKFFIAAELYQIVYPGSLPEAMANDFMELKVGEFKSMFSITNGKFVRNRDVELPEIPQEEYDFLYEYFMKKI